MIRVLDNKDISTVPPREIEPIVSDCTSQKEAVSSDPPSSKPKTRLLPPTIDTFLQIKWGLALLGEEKGREYLEWLQKKREQTYS